MGDSLDFLLGHPLVAAERVAVMGVCQSGEYPLVLNSVRHELAANIVVYGGAQKRAWELSETRKVSYESILERITAPVLGIWGEGDWVVSVPDVLRLRNTLELYRKNYEFTLFRDMPHGWMNSTMPGRYRPKQTEEAWGLILDFLNRVFEGDFPKDRVVWRFRSDTSPSYDFAQKVRLA